MKSIQFQLAGSTFLIKWKHLKSGVVRKHTIKEEKRVVYRKEIHPTTTVLYLWQDQKEISRGIAILSKEDKFNAKTGLLVALDDALIEAVREEKLTSLFAARLNDHLSMKIFPSSFKG